MVYNENLWYFINTASKLRVGEQNRNSALTHELSFAIECYALIHQMNNTYHHGIHTNLSSEGRAKGNGFEPESIHINS